MPESGGLYREIRRAEGKVRRLRSYPFRICRGADYLAHPSGREGPPDRILHDDSAVCARDHAEGAAAVDHFHLPGKSYPYSWTSSQRRHRTGRARVQRGPFPRHISVHCQSLYLPWARGMRAWWRGNARTNRRQMETGAREDPAAQSHLGGRFPKDLANWAAARRREAQGPKRLRSASPRAFKDWYSPKAYAGGSATRVARVQQGRKPTLGLWAVFCSVAA